MGVSKDGVLGIPRNLYKEISEVAHILLVSGSRNSFCHYYLQDGKEGNKVQNLEENQISHHDIGVSHTVCNYLQMK